MGLRPLIEVIAISLGVLNALILLVKPITRIHSRLDSQDARLASLDERLDRIERNLYSDGG